MSIRGLPDERPRPSVANLIGRFEQRASKRQSVVGPPGASPTASPSPSRSTSVVSHNTGDSAAIEVKERREWPPPQYQTQSQVKTPPEKVTGAINLDELRKSLVNVDIEKTGREGVKSPSTDAQNDATVPPSLSISTENIAKEAPLDTIVKSDPTPALVIENPPTPKEEQDRSVTVQATGKISASKSTPISANSASRTATSTTRGAAQRSSAAAQSKSNPSTPMKPAKPLTAQRTGTSTTSTHASRIGAKSPPASVLRSKTPNALRPSTSGSGAKANAARSKTPTPSKIHNSAAPAPGAARPKTPSSGLYAPTKASLARIRNAEAAPPPAVKKTVPPSALERLMKPTAASASKVRTDPVSPPRAPAVKTGARGAAPTRGAILKPRIGLAGARMKTEREKREKEKQGAKAAGAGAASVRAQPTSGDESLEHSVPSELAHSGDEYVEQPSFVSEAATAESESISDVHSELEHDGSQVASDIESYDDAFASDDDRKLDSAHILSALPREQGELAPFAEPEPEPKPEVPEQKVEEQVVEEQVPAGGEEIKDATEEEVAAAAAETAETEEAISESHTEEEGVEVEVKSEVEISGENGAATPKPTALKHNGVTAPVPETEFDSVMGMLQVKPPRAVALGEIPDED